MMKKFTATIVMMTILAIMLPLAATAQPAPKKLLQHCCSPEHLSKSIKETATSEPPAPDSGAGGSALYNCKIKPNQRRY